MTLKELLALAKKSGHDLNAIQTEINTELATTSLPKKKFKQLKVEKEMYHEIGKKGASLEKFGSLSDYLESLDPSGNYPADCGTAFERQLAANGLNISGKNSIRLEEFYNTPASSVLFPEFVNQQIQMGQLLGRHTLKAEDMVATSTQIDSGTYETAIASLTAGDQEHKIIAEGTEFPEVTISISQKDIKLRKRGALIKETYEHMRRIKANKMAVFLRLIGWKLALAKAADALDVVMNGNTGNSNPAFSHTVTTLSFDNLIDFWLEFHPYEADLVILPKAGLGAVLKLSEFKDPLIGSAFITNGELVTPLGWRMKRHDPEVAAVLLNNMVALDTRFTLEAVEERGSNITETDKLIDSQWNRIAFSFVGGYAKIIADASGVWDYS